jgi:hypothetical protein
MNVELYTTSGCMFGTWSQPAVPPLIGDYIEQNGKKYKVVQRWWLCGGYTLRIICEEVV